MRDDCPHCGESHRMMEPCPQAPGFLELLGEWFDGQRTATHYLAISGTIALGVLIVLAVTVAVHGG